MGDPLLGVVNTGVTLAVLLPSLTGAPPFVTDLVCVTLAGLLLFFEGASPLDVGLIGVTVRGS